MKAMLRPLCALLLAQGAWGQPLPDALRTPLCEPGQPLGYTTTVNAAAREYLWRGVSVNPGGYLEVQVDSRYLGLIDHLKALATPADGARVATLIESPFRQSTFHSDALGRIMLTRWEFGNAKATICIPTEFLNAEIAGLHGTLTLNRSVPRSEKVLWKLTWASDKLVQYELYMEDRYVDGRPTRSKAEVLKLAEALSETR